jgi:hypothetical protein
MANATENNVIVVDTTGYQDTRSLRICGIKYLPGTSASIKSADNSGTVLWETASTAEMFDEAEIYAKDGIYVSIAGAGAKVYIYLKV